MTTFTYVLDLISSILLWLSVLGALLTIITFAVFGDIRTYPIKLIMFLCACIAAAYSIFSLTFYSFVIDTFLCWPVAILIHYFFLTIFGWSFAVAFNFYQMIVRRNRDSERLEKWYHVGCWIGPLLICIATAASRNYGRVGGTGACYIPGNIARLIAFFLPGLIVIACNAILFFFIGREIHETLATAPKTDKRERRKELRVYVSIFISISLTWIFGYLEFLIPVPVVQSIFFVLFSLSTPLQGFFIFASYCWNRKVGGKWAGLFGNCLPFCKKWEEMASSTTSSRF